MIATPSEISSAAALLREGKLVAFPTETVYGLGADAKSDSAVASIYAAKDRPQFNPLIVHVPSLDFARAFVRVTPLAEKLSATFWPGALTLVLERLPDCPLSLLVSAGMDTVAIRVPAHPIAQQLLKEANLPVAAPSANRSGRISPTEAAHVASELPDVFILDGGPCAIGLESTVVDSRGEFPVLLRAGSVTREMLEKIAGKVGTPESAAILAPGMLASHYAPEKMLRLNATDVRAGEALLAFGDVSHVIPSAVEGSRCLDCARHDNFILNLSPSSNLQEAAANLFKMLRILDVSGAASIAAMPIPTHGIGAAINDRLQRAAAPKQLMI